MSFTDGITNFFNGLANARNPLNQNRFQQKNITDDELRAIYATGLGSKIVRLKSGHALKDTIQFDSAEDKKYYDSFLSAHVKDSAKFMLGFGRGIMVLHNRTDNLKDPLTSVDPKKLMINTFSGDMVTVPEVSRDLKNPRYYKPIFYVVRGEQIHYSRVIDFTYVRPPELDLPEYKYGGYSEFELIYDQLIADGIVQRASPEILEKASSFFYKIKGFKAAMKNKQEKEMVAYFARMEDARSIYGAGLVDSEDELEVLSQNISQLSESDQITLRRLAMVTGIPLAVLIGESPRGMNSTGDTELKVFQDTIETLQSDYLLTPINELMRKLSMQPIEFKENQGETPASRIEYETKAIANAAVLATMGEDSNLYLEEKGILPKDNFDEMFK